MRVLWIGIIYLAGFSFLYGIEIRELIQKSIRSHPKLQALEEMISVYKHRAEFAGSLEDLNFSLAIHDIQLRDPLNRRIEPMQRISFELAQKFPWFSKLSTREERLEIFSQMASYRLEEEKLFLIYRLYQEAYRYWEVKEKLRILQEYRKVLRELIRLSASLYQVGRISQAQVLDVKVFDSFLREKEVRLQNKEGEILSNIRYLSLQKEIQTVEVDPLFPEEIAPLSTWITLLKSRNPTLQFFAKQIEERRKYVKLAKLDYYPDIYLFSSYSWRDSFEDYISLGVRLNLPVYAASRQSEKVQEALSLEREAQKVYLDIFLSLKKEVEESFYRAKGSYESYLVLESLIGETEKVYESLISEYAVGKEDVFDVLKALNQILEVKLKKVERIREFSVAYRNLERLGARLP